MQLEPLSLSDPGRRADCLLRAAESTSLEQTAVKHSL